MYVTPGEITIDKELFDRLANEIPTYMDQLEQKE